MGPDTLTRVFRVSVTETNTTLSKIHNGLCHPGIKEYRSHKGIATSRTMPYHLKGNAQYEQYNGTVWKRVRLARLVTLFSRFTLGNGTPRRITLYSIAPLDINQLKST